MVYCKSVGMLPGITGISVKLLQSTIQYGSAPRPQRFCFTHPNSGTELTANEIWEVFLVRDVDIVVLQVFTKL